MTNTVYAYMGAIVAIFVASLVIQFSLMSDEPVKENKQKEENKEIMRKNKRLFARA